MENEDVAAVVVHQRIWTNTFELYTQSHYIRGIGYTWDNNRPNPGAGEGMAIALA